MIKAIALISVFNRIVASDFNNNITDVGAKPEGELRTFDIFSAPSLTNGNLTDDILMYLITLPDVLRDLPENDTNTRIEVLNKAIVPNMNSNVTLLRLEALALLRQIMRDSRNVRSHVLVSGIGQTLIRMLSAKGNHILRTVIIDALRELVVNFTDAKDKLLVDSLREFSNIMHKTKPNKIEFKFKITQLLLELLSECKTPTEEIKFKNTVAENIDCKAFVDVLMDYDKDHPSDLQTILEQVLLVLEMRDVCVQYTGLEASIENVLIKLKNNCGMVLSKSEMYKSCDLNNFGYTNQILYDHNRKGIFRTCHSEKLKEYYRNCKKMLRLLYSRQNRLFGWDLQFKSGIQQRSDNAIIISCLPTVLIIIFIMY